MLATIGYERATLDAVIDKLTAAEIDVVIDVRAVAASRRAGFSKTALSASLAEAGIDYVHLRGLGTPKDGREAARKGRIAEMRAIFDTHMETDPALAAFEAAVEIVQTRRAALLCFEAEAEGCHRRCVAERLRARLGVETVDL